jgi:sugar lactone lactonase YvrE
VRRGPAAALVALACLAATPATALAAPGDIAVADEGSWFGQTGAVMRVSPAGAATFLAGGAPFSNPWAVAVEADGSLLVADEGAEAVFRVTRSGVVSTIVKGAGLDDPVGIALAPGGKAYLSDRNSDAVLRLDLAAGTLTKVADLRDASGLAFDKAGRLLVTDGRSLQRVDPATGVVTTAAAGAPFDEPRDVAVAQDGTVYVLGYRQVVRISPGTGAKKVLAEGAPLNDPSAIDIEPDGDLVVADRDSAGGSVIRINHDTGAKSILATGAAFRRPTGIATVGGAGVDASGGGNGDPHGPAAPPPPPPPPGGTGGTGGTGGSGGSGGTPGTPGGGGTTVTLPNGTVITLPPGITPGTSGIPGVDFTAPSFLRKPKLSVRRFRAAHHGRAFVSLSVGTFINYALSEVARLTISVQKYRPLSRICRRRLAQQSRHRTGARCRRYISLQGRYTTASAAGVGRVRFRGRLKGRTLKPGRYRFVIRATDGAGNTTKPRRPVFRIVR